MNSARPAIALLLVTGLPLSAQPCTPQWEVAVGNPGISGGYAAPVRLWNDGSGPRLFVGGSFTAAGGSAANRYLARLNLDTNTWSSLGSGISGGFTNAFMTALIPFSPDRGPERLVAAGFFDTAGGVAGTASLAMWNGTSWEAMGTTWTGTTRGSIWSTAVWNGRLYVGGSVVNSQPSPAPPGTGYPIGGAAWQGVASWDGQSWRSDAFSVINPGGTTPVVNAMAVFNDGSGEALYIAGRFTSIDGVPGTSLIARWNGTSWSSVGGGLTSTSALFGPEALVVFDDGSGKALYIGGYTFFGPGMPATNVAKWNGSVWSSAGGVLGTGRITSLAAFDDGQGRRLYAGGTAMPGFNYIARFNAGSWQILGGGVTGPAIPPGNFPSVFGLGVTPNRLYVTGNFTQLDNTLNANGLAAWTACPATCYANCDGSTGTPSLTANDFLCFLNKYANSDLYANCDGSTGLPALTANDFLCFINKFASGCS